jgi:DEAD/DEAH box helicase domain-containing protein
MAPLLLGCDPSEVGVECAVDVGRPLRLLLYDKARGGLGLAAELHRHLPALLAAARERMRSCDCARGCICCTHSPFCTHYNGRQDKNAGVALIDALLRQDEPGDDGGGGGGDGGGGGEGEPEALAGTVDDAAPNSRQAVICMPCAEGEAALGRFEL